ISAAQAQVSIPSLGAPVTENFNSLTSSPDGALSSTLPTGWFLSETGTSLRVDGKYAVGSGGSGTGDTYGFGPTGAADRAFGTLFSSTITPTIGAQFKNNTGSPIGSVLISYTGEE